MTKNNKAVGLLLLAIGILIWVVSKVQCSRLGRVCYFSPKVAVVVAGLLALGVWWMVRKPGRGKREEDRKKEGERDKSEKN